MQRVNLSDNQERRSASYFTAQMPAGPAGSAQGYIEESIDLNEMMIGHPNATYFMRLRGDAMAESGIGDGDLLVVDRAMPVEHGNIIIAPIGGQFTIRELATTPTTRLIPHNKNYATVYPETPLQVFGRVTFVIKAITKNPFAG